MIYVTGDLHGGFELQKLMDWDEGGTGDYLIIAGDFGLPWDFSREEREDISWLESRPYTVLFVDGNHERYDYWAKRPGEKWHGGLVQRLSPASPIRRLMRSEVYEIDGTRIFTMGGAASIDRAYRTPYVDWWPHEIPTTRNFEEALENLDEVGWEVDYVVTHTCPRSLLPRTLYPAAPAPGLPDEGLTKFFDEIDARLKFKRWYYGHFHKDMDLDDRHTLLYDAIVPIGAGVDSRDETQKENMNCVQRLAIG